MGATGYGKTLLAKAVASQARANFIAVNGSELLSRWGVPLSRPCENYFKARQAAPCVVFIDEIDTGPSPGLFSKEIRV